MKKYKVTFRKREPEPKDEKFVASYDVDALDVEGATKQARVLFSKQFPDLDPVEYDLDTQWVTELAPD